MNERWKAWLTDPRAALEAAVMREGGQCRYARRVGVPQSSVSRWLAGRGRMPASALVDAVFLLEGIDVPSRTGDDDTNQLCMWRRPLVPDGANVREQDTSRTAANDGAAGDVSSRVGGA